MKTLITYSTLTGNTQKVAEAIFEILEGEKEIMPMKNVKDLASYGRIIAGFWVDKGEANQEAGEFIGKLKNKELGIFGTLGAYHDSDHATRCIANVIARVSKHNKVIATFLCQGAIDPKIITRIKEMAALSSGRNAITPERKQLWKDAAGHPDQQDLENAKRIFSVFNL